MKPGHKQQEEGEEDDLWPLADQYEKRVYGKLILKK